MGKLGIFLGFVLEDGLIIIFLYVDKMVNFDFYINVNLRLIFVDCL